MSIVIQSAYWYAELGPIMRRWLYPRSSSKPHIGDVDSQSAGQLDFRHIHVADDCFVAPVVWRLCKQWDDPRLRVIGEVPVPYCKHHL